MNFGNCCHCTHPIRDAIYVYPKSKARAHYACVSQPSAEAMDLLLVKALGTRRRAA